MTATRNAIVRGARMANRGLGGGRSYAGVKGLLNYLAFGRYTDRLGRAQVQRGTWLDHNMEEQSHEHVLNWAKEKVHHYGYGYAYQMLLSTRHSGLDRADYNRVLQEGSRLSGVREWIYTVHEDTEHQHAHAILFRKEKMSRAEYRRWQAALQAGLERVAAARARISEAEQEEGMAQAAVGGPGGAEEQREQGALPAAQNAAQEHISQMEVGL